MLNKSDLSSSLDFVINRLFMKLFRTNIIETVEVCDQFGFDKPSVLWARRVRNFDSKFVASKMPFVS